MVLSVVVQAILVCRLFAACPRPHPFSHRNPAPFTPRTAEVCPRGLAKHWENRDTRLRITCAYRREARSGVRSMNNHTFQGEASRGDVDHALMTGTDAQCAKSSMVVCMNTRATIALTQRSRLRATS